jgi:ribonuclease kappa
VLSVTQQLTQPGKAWFCTVISAFGIVILGVLGLLFKSGSESMVGSINDPKDGAA